MRSNAKKSQICQLIDDSKNELSDPRDIQTEIKNYYTKLFSSKLSNSLPDIDMSFHPKTKLNDFDKSLCEGLITKPEAFEALNSMPTNKTPGNDGLSVEFYITFWTLIGDLVVNSINMAYMIGTLSNTQNQGVITLIEKKDKDKRFIRNWRPITLLNTDYKIASKCIASRLDKVLPKIIHITQTAFVKN